MTAWLHALLGWFVDWDILDRYGYRILQGLSLTLQLVGVSVALGFGLGMLIAHARLSRSRLLSSFAYGYTTFFRGTPLLCQLFLVYYGIGLFLPDWRETLEGLGLWAYFRDAYVWVVLTFTLNTAAYQAEALRGAMQAVPKGQSEAARALGLGTLQILRTIVWPQALLVALRPLGNELIIMIKASSIASLATLLDLMGQTRFIFARTFDLSVYLYAAVLYLIMVETIRRLWGFMEVRLLRPTPSDDRSRSLRNTSWLIISKCWTTDDGSSICIVASATPAMPPSPGRIGV